MAIWQHRIDLLPVKAVQERFGELPLSIPVTDLDSVDWWTNAQPPKEIELWVQSVLPTARSWSPAIRIWGDEEGDSISLMYAAADRIEWISCRIDLRRLSLPFVTTVCELASRLQCVLLSGAYVLSPEYDHLLTDIRHSKAAAYLNDPVAALKALKPREALMVPMPKTTEETQ